METNKPTKIIHRFELGGNLTYILVVLSLLAFLFAMSYYDLWSVIK